MKLLNKLKIAILIALFIIIFFNLKAFAVTGVITEITVNMRKEPSTNSKVLRFVTQDYKVEVLEKVGEWYKIKYNGVTGYVYGEYVDVDDSKLEVKDTVTEEPKQEEVKQEETTNKNEDTNNTQKENEKEPIPDVSTDITAELEIKENGKLRLIPNITSGVIYTAKKAVSVDVVEQFAGWSYVYVDNVYGWVRTDNIVEKNSMQSGTSDKDDDIEIEYTERTVAYIKYTSVNLRKKASTSSTVLAKLKLNNEVIVLEKVSSKWTKVEYDGITGYVSADLLSTKKVDEKEESTSSSRDGETVSRDEVVIEKVEETTKKEETTTNTTVKEENTSSKDKETTSSTEIKKEETNDSVANKEDKETSKDTETKKEETSSSENKKEDTEASSKNEVVTSKTKGEEIVEYAKTFLGYDYVYGGASPKTGFDCSGFTYYVYKHFGYTLSRASTAQVNNGKEVAKSDLQPGDLLIFKNQSLTRIGHVGIYIGNNKMIHSSEPGVGVVITDLNASGYNYNKRYVTARRIVE